MTSTDSLGSDFDPQYYPDWERFAQGRSRRLAHLGNAAARSDGTQFKISSEMSWDGADLDPESYMWKISDSDLQEIETVCADYACELLTSINRLCLFFFFFSCFFFFFFTLELWNFESLSEDLFYSPY